MRIRLLGPVELWGNDSKQPIDLRQKRLLLAVLALRAGSVVPLDHLVSLLWPAGPPANPKASVHTRISGLRKDLGEHGRQLRANGFGYVLDIDPLAVDALEFRALVHRAAVADSDARRVSLLDQALALWRGHALADATTSTEIRAQLVAGLEEARLVAREDRLDAELRLGKGTELLEEAGDLCRADPHRERPQRQLALALHRSGQTARALEHIRAYRERCVHEFGLDPSPKLDQLELAILRADPSLQPAAEPAPVRTPAPTPAQLPLPPEVFAGREAEVEQLDRLVTGSCRVALLTGAGGVGKTGLALWWAHRVAARHFPDGQLYLDLRGHDDTPVRPIDALARLLRGVGIDWFPVTVSQADDVDEAAALLRSTLAGRRMLLLLDNAADLAQVAPLLPGSAATRVIVSSRHSLTDLVYRHDAHRISLDPLSETAAEELLLRLGGERMAAAPAMLGPIADACARTPLALRIAAARIAEEPDVDLDRLLTELRSGPATAPTADEAVDIACLLTYDRLDATGRQLFRLLGLIPGPDFTAPAVAALLRTTEQAAAGQLERLAAVHVVERRPGERYAMHDRLRRFARDRVPASKQRRQRQPTGCSPGTTRSPPARRT